MRDLSGAIIAIAAVLAIVVYAWVIKWPPNRLDVLNLGGLSLFAILGATDEISRRHYTSEGEGR